MSRASSKALSRVQLSGQETRNLRWQIRMQLRSIILCTNEIEEGLKVRWKACSDLREACLSMHSARVVPADEWFPRMFALSKRLTRLTNARARRVRSAGGRKGRAGMAAHLLFWALYSIRAYAKALRQGWW